MARQRVPNKHPGQQITTYIDEKTGHTVTKYPTTNGVMRASRKLKGSISGSLTTIYKARARLSK